MLLIILKAQHLGVPFKIKQAFKKNKKQKKLTFCLGTLDEACFVLHCLTLFIRSKTTHFHCAEKKKALLPFLTAFETIVIPPLSVSFPWISVSWRCSLVSPRSLKRPRLTFQSFEKMKGAT